MNNNAYSKKPAAAVVRLELHAQQLKNVTAFRGTSDPFAVVTLLSNSPSEQPRVIGKTEVIHNTLSPRWTTKFDLPYELGTTARINVGVWAEAPGTTSNKPMGSAVFEVGEVLASKGNTKAKKLRQGGTLFCRITPAPEEKGVLKLQLVGRALKNVDGLFSKPNPYLEISARVASAGGMTWQAVHRSNPVLNNLNPDWEMAKLELSRLAPDGDLNRPILVEVWDWNKHGQRTPMGKFECSVASLLSSAGRTNKFILTRNERNYGNVMVLSAYLEGHDTNNPGRVISGVAPPPPIVLPSFSNLNIQEQAPTIPPKFPTPVPMEQNENRYQGLHRFSNNPKITPPKITLSVPKAQDDQHQRSYSNLIIQHQAPITPPTPVTPPPSEHMTYEDHRQSSFSNINVQSQIPLSPPSIDPPSEPTAPEALNESRCSDLNFPDQAPRTPPPVSAPTELMDQEDQYRSSSFDMNDPAPVTPSPLSLYAGPMAQEEHPISSIFNMNIQDQSPMMSPSPVNPSSEYAHEVQHHASVFNLYNQDQALILPSLPLSAPIAQQENPPPRRPSFVEYLAGGLELDLAIAVDFTGSNGNPHQPGTLHYIHPDGQLNDYEKAITAVGGIIARYDSDQKFSVLGFGAKYSGIVRHCFQVGDGPELEGLSEVLRAYRNVFLSGLVMSSPTVFSEVIDYTAAASRRRHYDLQKIGKQAYKILLILTDGAVTNVEATKQSIRNAADAPMSIVIVGVGSANFQAMRDLDDFLSQSPDYRDIVQFVEFSQHAHNRRSLTSETLKEIPDQIVDFFHSHGIAPLPPVSGSQLSLVADEATDDDVDLNLAIHANGEISLLNTAGAVYDDTIYNTQLDYVTITPVAAPVVFPSRMFQVQVPNGICAGSQVQVTNPVTQQQMVVTVPPGVTSGSVFNVRF